MGVMWDLGCLPFTSHSQKFWLGCKWKMFFWFIPLENYQDKWKF